MIYLNNPEAISHLCLVVVRFHSPANEVILTQTQRFCYKNSELESIIRINRFGYRGTWSEASRLAWNRWSLLQMKRGSLTKQWICEFVLLQLQFIIIFKLLPQMKQGSPTKLRICEFCYGMRTYLRLIMQQKFH